MTRYTTVARRLADGRVNVVITDTQPQFSSDRTVYSYTRVGNIDGSAPFMLDNGGWTFLPHGNDALCQAVYAAECGLLASEAVAA